MEYDLAIEALRAMGHVVEMPHLTAGGKIRIWIDGVSVSIGKLSDLAEGKVTLEDLKDEQ